MMKHPERNIRWELDVSPDANNAYLEGYNSTTGREITKFITDLQDHPDEGDILRRGQQLRDQCTDVSGECLPVSVRLTEWFHDQGVPATVEKSPVDGRRHWSVRANSDFVTGYDCEERLVVDATVDQFHRSFPGVLIGCQEDLDVYS